LFVRNKRVSSEFKGQIRQIIKKADPKAEIDASALSALNEVAKNVVKRLGLAAADLAAGVGNTTLKIRDVKMAAKLAFGDVEAAAKYAESASTAWAGQEPKSRTITPRMIGKNEVSSIHERRTRTTIVAAPKVKQILQSTMPTRRIGGGVAIFVAGFVEYVIKSIVETALTARKDKSERLKPTHLSAAAMALPEFGIPAASFPKRILY
jgi:histone H3/H4